MATIAIGSVGAFDNDQEDWESYIERAEFYMEANGILEADAKRATLLSIMGRKTFDTVKNLAAPKGLKEVTYDEPKKLRKGHSCPTPAVTVQRYKFNSRTRGKEETVADFVELLRHIALHCDYKDSLDEMLRDRLICGINDKRIQCRLLAEKKTTLGDVLGLAQAMEAADKDAKHLTEETETAKSIHVVQRKVQKRSETQGNYNKSMCYRRGGKHSQETCWYKEAECHACGNKGHIARVCKTNPDYWRRGSNKTRYKETTDKMKRGNHRQREHVNKIAEVDDEQEESEEVYAMFEMGNGNKDVLPNKSSCLT